MPKAAITTKDAGVNEPSLEELKEQRNIRDLEKLDKIKSQNLPKMKLEDQLYSHYRNFVNDEVRPSTSLNNSPKRIRNLQLNFLNNRWAIWLDSIREQLDCLHLQEEAGKQSIEKKFRQFKENMLDILNGTGRTGVLFAEFTSELIKLGIAYETRATKSFTSALMNCETNEAGLIAQESWESFCNGLSATYKFVTGDMSVADLGQQLQSVDDLELGKVLYASIS